MGLALIRDGTGSDVLGKLARHEASLMNAFTKTLQMLLLLLFTGHHERPGMFQLLGAIYILLGIWITKP